MPMTNEELDRLRKNFLNKQLDRSEQQFLNALLAQQWQVAEDLIQQNAGEFDSVYSELGISVSTSHLYALYTTTEPDSCKKLKKILETTIDKDDEENALLFAQSIKRSTRCQLLYTRLAGSGFEDANKIFNHGVTLNCTPTEALNLLFAGLDTVMKINDPLWNSLMSAAGGSDVVLTHALSQNMDGVWLAKICHARGVTLTNDKAVDELLKLSLDKRGTLSWFQKNAPELINFLKELKATHELNEALADYEKHLDAADKFEMTGKPLSKKAAHAGETLQDVRTLKSTLDSKNPASLAKFGEAFEKIDAKLSKIESPIWKKIKRIWKQITNPAWRQERKDHIGKHHGLWKSHREVFLERVKKNLGPTRGKKK